MKASERPVSDPVDQMAASPICFTNPVLRACHTSVFRGPQKRFQLGHKAHALVPSRWGQVGKRVGAPAYPTEKTYKSVHHKGVVRPTHTHTPPSQKTHSPPPRPTKKQTTPERVPGRRQRQCGRPLRADDAAVADRRRHREAAVRGGSGELLVGG